MFYKGDVIAPTRFNNPHAKRRRRISPATWLAAILILPCGFVLGKRARLPYLQAGQLCAQNDFKERKIADLEYKNQHIENKINSLESRDGIDYTARPLGWVGPNERRIIPPKD